MDHKTTPHPASAHWLASGYGWRIRHYPHAWRPPTDLYETEDEYVLLVEVAGMQSTDFVISYERKVLSVQGNRQAEVGAKTYHQMEISNGNFVTEVSIAKPVESDRIVAVYKDGFLHVTLPKMKSKQIPIDG